MPRIRTIKPEAWGHRKVGRLSRDARLLWAVLITQADDEGRLVADPGQLRRDGGYTYDTDHVTEDDVAKWLAEIDAMGGLIRCYVVDGVPYVDLPSWKDHQRINKPTKSKLPPCPIPGPLPEPSRSTPGALPEPSRSTTHGSEGIKDQGSRIKDQGREGSAEGRGSTSTAVLSLSNPGQPSHSALRETAEAEVETIENQLREMIQNQHKDWSFQQVEQEVVAIKALTSRKHVATVRPKSER